MPRPLQLVALLLAIGLGLLVRPSAQTPTAAIIQRVDTAVAKGPFAPNWTSLEHFTVPAWYEDGKFGIFIHWGAVLGAGLRQRMVSAQHVQEGHAGVRPPRGNLRPAVASSATRISSRASRPSGSTQLQWAALFKDAGARYVVPVAEHHDGFPMYDCSLTDWSAAKMGPKRDIIGELARAVRAQGLVFGVSSHRAEHWWFFDQGMTFDSDVRDPKNAAFYGPAVNQVTSEKQASRLPTRRTSTTGWRGPRSSWTSTSRSSSGSTGGSHSRRSSRSSSASRPSTTTAARSGARALPSTTRNMAASRFLTPQRYSTSNAGNWQPYVRTSGRPTRRSRRTPGATSRVRSTRRPIPSSTTSSTS